MPREGNLFRESDSGLNALLTKRFVRATAAEVCGLGQRGKMTQMQTPRQAGNSSEVPVFLRAAWTRLKLYC